MKIYKLFAIILFTAEIIFGQVVYEPLNNEVYNYLSLLSRKGIINFEDLMKPVSRKYILEKLLEAEQKTAELTDLEKEELDYYKRDYCLEMETIKQEKENEKENEGKKKITYFGEDEAGRIRLFSYSDNLFKINADPLLGYEMRFPQKEREIHTWNGLYLYGYLSDFIGSSFYFSLDNVERRREKETMNHFSPATGRITVSALSKYFDYSETHAMVTADWSWGSFSVGKDFIQYGYAESGKLVLSSKAPSFPFFRLNLKPVDWLGFLYFHAWLNSDVIDTLSLVEYRRNIYREKYFAWHAVVITPLNGFDISIGESIVYSDRLEFIYLIPVMFFYLADDFVSSRINKPGDANSQLFVSASSRNHIKNTHLYGTVFIDELTIPNLDNTLFPNGRTIEDEEYKRRLRTQLGFTAGGSISDLPFNNLTFTVEYTRINPFVYGHHTPAQKYTNSSYLMGHWIGHNSDLLYLRLSYRILRGLQAAVWGEYIRKASEDYSGQYKEPQPEFLFGLKRTFTYAGFDLKYEMIHELNVQASVQFNKISEEQEAGNFIISKTREFSFSLFYGL
jgi:hypothetical protein